MSDQLQKVRTLSVSIARDWREVYAFVAKPENFNRWASGVGGSFRCEDGIWIAEGETGRVVIRFCSPNDYGVLDHWVTLPTDDVVYSPMRVLANGSGAEMTFTLFQLPGMTDKEFERDAGLVTADLQTLKTLLEG